MSGFTSRSYLCTKRACIALLSAQNVEVCRTGGRLQLPSGLLAANQLHDCLNLYLMSACANFLADCQGQATDGVALNVAPEQEGPWYDPALSADPLSEVLTSSVPCSACCSWPDRFTLRWKVSP